MSISQRFDDPAQQKMRSIMSLDYDIKNLIDIIFKSQDQYTISNPFKGYSVFFHEQNETIFFHKDQNFTSEISQSWSDLEYGESQLLSESELNDKNDFSKKLQGIINFSKANMNYNIENISDCDSFFFKFVKQNEKFLSIVYPVIVKELQSPFNRIQKKETVMFIGRVQNDKSDLLFSSSWEKRITYLCNFLQPFLILIIIFGCIMHYAAVLVFRIEVPIKLLKTFITQRVNHYESMKKNPNMKQFRQIDCPSCIKGNNQGVCNKQYKDKLNLNKEGSDKMAIMNTFILPLKERNSFSQSEKILKQNKIIKGYHKNTSLLITCNRNSGNLHKLEKYCEEDSNTIQNKMIVIASQQLYNQDCQPMDLHKHKLLQSTNKSSLQLNCNKLLREQSNQISKPPQQNIFSHLCLKKQQYLLGHKYYEQDEQSEVDSDLNQLKSVDGKLIQQLKQSQNFKDLQPNHDFQNSILESNHPIYIIQNQQTPRLENDRDEEFQELNQQLQNEEQQQNIQYVNSTNFKAPSTPKEIYKPIELKQIEQKIEMMVETEGQRLNTEFSNKTRNNFKHLLSDIDIEKQKLPQPNENTRIDNKTQKEQKAIIKGINFFQRTQSFLKQQLSQITESAKQFKTSSIPIEKQSSFQLHLKDIQSINSPLHQNKQGIIDYIGEKKTAHFNQKRYEQFIGQSEADCKEQISNSELDQVIVHLEDIQTYSHEIQVIVNTFQHLFSVISYMEEGYEKEDFVESLFRLNHAVTIFKYINNISAVGMAYFDIGNLYFGDERFEEAIESYSISLSCAFQQFEVNSVDHFNQVLSSGELPFDYIALSQFLPRLYFISLSFKELAVSQQEDVQLIGRDSKSNYLLNQAVIHFKTGLRVAAFLKKLQNDQFKQLEIIIFTYLFLSEVYVYLNEDFLSETTLKEATKNFEMLIHKNQSINSQNKYLQKSIIMGRNTSSQGKIQTDSNLMEQIHLIKVSFYYVRGIIQIKKGLFKDGCLSLTNYLENIRAFQYQKKALLFLKNEFKKQILDTNTIEKQIQKIIPVSYDIFILIDIYELALSSISRPSLQLDILKHIKQAFIKPDDKVCIILYGQEFHILQPLMVFQNNKHWDICFENIKNALNTQRCKQTSFPQIPYELQTAPILQKYDSTSPHPPPSLQDYYYNQNPENEQKSSYSDWEMALFKSLKEISIQEIATPIDITQTKRKAVLLTFSFSQTSPIQNQNNFSDNFITLLSTFHKLPTVLNLFYPLKQDSVFSSLTNSQKMLRFQDSLNNGNLDNQQNLFQQHQRRSKTQFNRNSKFSIINKQNFNQHQSLVQTPLLSNIIVNQRTREQNNYDLNDDQLYSTAAGIADKTRRIDSKRQDSLPPPHLNKLINALTKNKIKKFHLFQKEYDLYMYLQQKRVLKGNFYLLQRKFFK